MNTVQRMFTCAALAVTASGLAMADQVVTYTGTYGPAATDFTFSGGSSISLQQFDPGSYGVPLDAVLTGVSLELLASETTTNLTITNNASGVQSFGATLTDNVEPLSDSASAETNFLYNADAAVTVFTTYSGTGGSLSNPPKTITLGGTSNAGTCPTATPSSSCNSVTYSNVTVTGNSGPYAISSNFWSGYEGSGTFQITGETSATTSFNGGGNNVAASVATNATITAEVLYTYTEPTGTPEPATMVLFGSALVGLGLLRKRARA